MLVIGKHIKKLYQLLIITFLLITVNKSGFSQNGIYDTLIHEMIVYDGDTIESKTLLTVYTFSQYNKNHSSVTSEWTRLRNAVYTVYPFAKRAGAIMNDINSRLQNVKDKDTRKKIIRSREKELRKEFTDRLTNLSIYQGKILMKLINRETGNNCYEIIKEYKGAVAARFYQTVAFLFNSNLKQPYDKNGEDAEIEKIVLEVSRMYS